ncbi:hypothetical protein BGZ91_004486, partial [Linnemannia elongata]
ALKALFVRQNPSLRLLRIDVKMDPKALLSLITNYVPKLQDLDLSVTWRGDVKVLLENLPEYLRIVRLRDVHHEAPGNTGEASRVEPGVGSRTMKRHHVLESFSIGGDLAGQDEDVLLPFLGSCSRNLKSFGGKWSVRFFHNARIASALSDLAPASIFTYVMWDCGVREPLGSHLQAVLSKATRLRTLQAHWLLRDGKISATDILSSEWATTSLEHVDSKIDVPRVNDDTLSSNIEAIQSSRDTQRQVLRRFGQQRNLRRLIIGGMAYSPASNVFGYQRNCLEMTLESGLDELVNLKNLEVLDIHHMDHRVGVPELEWMNQNLPNLQHLIGMGDNITPPSPEVRHWLQTHQSRFWR